MVDKYSRCFVLIQPSRDAQSRAYLDFPTMAHCLDGLCKLYEDVLKELNPAEPRMTYDLNDMLRYIDTFPEIIIMAPDSRTRLYTAHDRNWIKQSVVSHLQSIASQR